jgi:hypothetical protein
LEAVFHFVPERRAIVAGRFMFGLAIHRICVPEGNLKVDLGCCLDASFCCFSERALALSELRLLALV